LPNLTELKSTFENDHYLFSAKQWAMIKEAVLEMPALRKLILCKDETPIGWKGKVMKLTGGRVEVETYDVLGHVVEQRG
jgi:hypothetical protein